MKRRIAALIRRYGSSVQAVFPDRTEIVRAFLQPVTSRSWQNMDHMIPTGGEVPRGQFLYIGPPELDIRGAEHLYLAGRYFLVRRADMIVCIPATSSWGARPMTQGRTASAAPSARR